MTLRRREVIAGAGFALAFANAARAAPLETSRVTALIADYASKGLTDAAILVALEGAPVFRTSIGLADRVRGTKNDPGTAFRIASVTKQFTAVATLKLAETGKLSLDDRITRFIPGAPDAWRDVTVRHLLTHTSGIFDFTQLPGLDSRTFVNRPAKDIISLVGDRPLAAAPGAQFDYDNSGYVLLGLVVEAVSGASLGAFLQTHAFGPLRMRRTAFATPQPPAHHAVGYIREGAQWRPAEWMSGFRESGAGGLYSTVDDLLIWDRALHDGRLLRADSHAMMFSEQAMGHGLSYGFGYVMGENGGRRFWWHNGHGDGYSAMLAHYPDAGLAIIVLSNDDLSPVEHLARDIALAVLG